MKLAIVTASYPFGPSESFLSAELHALRAKGWEVTVIPIWARGERRTELSESPSTLIARPGRPDLLWRGAWAGLGSMAALRDAARLVRRAGRWRPRLVNTVLAPSGMALGRFLRGERFDHVHGYWATGPATVAMLAATVAGIPWSFTGHRWDVREDQSLGLKLESAVVARLISRATRSLVLENLRRRRPVAAQAEVLLAKRAVVSYLGVEVPPKTSAPGSGMRLVCPAALVPVKGHATLLAAWAVVQRSFSEARLDLAGDGPLREELGRLAADLGVKDSVRFLGTVPHRELLEGYARGEYSGLILPSLDLGGGLHEGIPVSLMEGMGYGLPVVSTGTGGIPELVSEECGWVVAGGDAAGLGQAIVGLLAAPAEGRRRGLAGRARIERDFSAAVQAGRFWGEVEARLRTAPAHSRST